MSKMLFPCLLLTASVFATPALPQTTGKNCKEEIKRAEAMMPTARDSGKSDWAEAQLRVAREMEMKKDEEGCLKQTENVMKEMKQKN